MNQNWLGTAVFGVYIDSEIPITGFTDLPLPRCHSPIQTPFDSLLQLIKNRGIKVSMPCIVMLDLFVDPDNNILPTH